MQLGSVAGTGLGEKWEGRAAGRGGAPRGAERGELCAAETRGYVSWGHVGREWAADIGDRLEWGATEEGLEQEGGAELEGESLREEWEETGGEWRRGAIKAGGKRICEGVSRGASWPGRAVVSWKRIGTEHAPSTEGGI